MLLLQSLQIYFKRRFLRHLTFVNSILRWILELRKSWWRPISSFIHLIFLHKLWVLRESSSHSFYLLCWCLIKSRIINPLDFTSSILLSRQNNWRWVWCIVFNYINCWKIAFLLHNHFLLLVWNITRVIRPHKICRIMLLNSWNLLFRLVSLVWKFHEMIMESIRV